MKKIISNVANFPNGCETVRFTACLVSMLMRADGITDKDCDFFCGRQKGNCIRCGQCDTIFDNLSDDELLKMRGRISAWIGQPIDQRAMLGSAMNPLRTGKEPDIEIVAYNEVNRLCWTSHDVLWIAWRAIGEYMGDDKLDWARGLKNKTIRRVIADCFALVRDHDEYMLEELKKGFEER